MSMLVLRLARRPDGVPPGADICQVKADGSTIGRAPDCDLVLDDPLRMVSRRHAWIHPQGSGEALLRCTSSTATMLVNGEPLPPGSECTVHPGDRLRIFGFEVLVEACSPEVAAPPPAEAPARAAAAAVGLATPADAAGPARRARLDQWFDLDTVADPLGPGSPLPAPEGAVAAPRPAADTPARRPAPPPPPAPPPAPARRAEAAAAEVPPAHCVDVDLALDEGEALRRAFLRGAGLEPSTPLALSPAYMEHLGALLRAMTEGTLAQLRSRAVAKQNIRAEGTRIVARENNVLKFAPDAATALKLLLDGHGQPGFLDPLDALRDAHDDLQVHQLAMIAGMRAAVFDLISRLGPEGIDAAEGPARGLARYLPLLRDAALWRRHRHDHAQLLANLDDTFEAAFGREFLLAYEAQSAHASEMPNAEPAARPERNAGLRPGA